MSSLCTSIFRREYHSKAPLEVSLQSPGEPLDLRGKIDFLICADVCIPDSVEIDFSLPGGPAEIAEGEAALLNSFETRIPADNSGGVGLQVETVAFEPASDSDNPLLVGFLDTRLASVFEMTAPDVFAEVPTPRFPGGTLLRWPGLVAGMLYYALRDRL